MPNSIVVCDKHGESKPVEFQGQDICRVCYDLYIEEIEELGKDTLFKIHEVVGMNLRKKLKDPAAFERFKILTDKGLDVIEMYHQIVSEVCRNAKMN